VRELTLQPMQPEPDVETRTCDCWQFVTNENSGAPILADMKRALPS